MLPLLQEVIILDSAGVAAATEETLRAHSIPGIVSKDLHDLLAGSSSGAQPEQQPPAAAAAAAAAQGQQQQAEQHQQAQQELEQVQQ